MPPPVQRRRWRETSEKEQTMSHSDHFAVIYCRVSSKKQTEDGNGLDSQETTCREYAERKGYRVLRVFSDDLSGKTEQRDGLKEMVAFLKKRRSGTKVIIDDLNRLARSVRTHFAIRDAIGKAGGKLESPKRIFADDPEEDILEVIEAAFAGEHRRKNAEQTLTRMRARCLNGYWCLALPLGYKYYKVKGQGALIQRDEPKATIIQNALESFACGQLQTQAEVARFLQSHPDFPRTRHGRVTDDQAHNILTNPLYAGYVHVPRWDVSLRPGHHPALIDYETFRKIERRLASKDKIPERSNRDTDFALRGAVVCGHCGTRLTSCWAKGSHARYPYYHCREKGCVAYGRSIPRDRIEGEFEALLKTLQPSRDLFAMTHKAFRILWQEQIDNACERKRHLKGEVKRIEQEIDQLVSRVVGASSETLIQAYERRIQELEQSKAEHTDMLANCGRPAMDFDTAFRTAMAFFSNPYKLWVSGLADHKKLVLKLAFSRPLEYVRESGFRTPLTSSPFTILSGFSGEGRGMAHPERFERPTLRFVV
ncbi:recombinase family protein [Sphingobium sp. OAS761]|uniref:recombinase family protein n=1 Tax=Sphingobium sp. OAS761 TaxID=2817901 RepID=UPI00345FBBC2